MEDFKDRLRKAIEIKSLKPIDISKKTGITKGTISNYLNGRYKAAQTNLYLISKALNVDEAWLMGYDVPMEKEDEEYNKFIESLVNAYNEAPEDIKKAVNKLLDLKLDASL